MPRLELLFSDFEVNFDRWNTCIGVLRCAKFGPINSEVEVKLGWSPGRSCRGL